MDEGRKLPGDFLYDGSVSSYVWRFVLCFTLGLFLDFILFFFLWIGDEELSALWMLYAAVPVVMGILGVFKFDAVVAVYDRINKSLFDRERYW